MLIVWQWKSNFFFPMKEKENSSPGFLTQEQKSLGYDFWWFKLCVCSYSEFKLKWGKLKRKNIEKNRVSKVQTSDITNRSQDFGLRIGESFNYVLNLRMLLFCLAVSSIVNHKLFASCINFISISMAFCVKHSTNVSSGHRSFSLVVG